MTQTGLRRVGAAGAHSSRRDVISDGRIIIREKNAQLLGLIRDVGFITDCIQRDVDGVSTVFTKLRGRARMRPPDLRDMRCRTLCLAQQVPDIGDIQQVSTKGATRVEDTGSESATG